METSRAFEMGELNRGRELKVFDWDKAARRIKETGTDFAKAGLQSDWEWTGGTIFQDGKPNHDSYTYLASTWATPELDLGNGPEDCYKMQSETDGWHSGTKWPDSALKILGE